MTGRPCKREPTYLNVIDSGWLQWSKIQLVIFNDEFLFIHVPKTAGIAVADGLCRSLKGTVYSASRPGESLSRDHVNIIHGDRHQTLKGADQFFKDAGLPHRLSRFKTILAMVRNPYEIEVSRFHYLRLGREWDRGVVQDLAMEGDFAKFVRGSTWWFKHEDYYVVDGVTPPNLQIVRYEGFAATISTDFASFFQTPFVVKQLNASHKTQYKDYYDKELEAHVYRKYQWLFDQGYYPREHYNRPARLSVFSKDDDWVRWHRKKPSAFFVRLRRGLPRLGDMQFWIDGLYKLLPLSAASKKAISGRFYARFGFLFKGTNGYQRWLSSRRDSQID